MKVLFRARTIDQDYTKETEVLKNIDGDWYAIGKEQTPTVEYFNGIKLCAIETYPCDYSTRSINFEDMLDSENNPIFVSLSKSGKGGDILEWLVFPENSPITRINGTPYYSSGGVFKVIGRIEMMWHMLALHRKCKVIGIQK